MQEKAKPTITNAALARNWHNIDWISVNESVRSFQTRILEAFKKGESSEVTRLQNDLVRSFAARALVVRKVTTNAGKGTPGIDGRLWDTPEVRFQAIGELQIDPKTYKASPVKRVWISKDGRPLQKDKSNGRPLGIPTMFDRGLQAVWLLALIPIAEEGADRHSYGFRPYRSAHDAIQMVFTRFSTRYRPMWVLEGDIEKCYDTISHKWVLQNIPMEKRILNQWLKAGFLDESRVWETEMGVPQGGPISPVIANMTLDGLQGVVQEAVKPITAINPTVDGRYPTKVTTIRYADDFVISAERKEILVDVVKPAIEKFLESRGMRLSPKKTVISNLWDGFNFLGFNARLYQDSKRETGKVLLIKPSKKSVLRIMEKISTVVKLHGQGTEAHLIERLNPILRGWGNYVRTGVSKRIFSKVRHHTWRVIWGWLIKKYPNESKPTLAHRHYKRIQGQSWVFVGERDSKTIQLFDIQSIAIKRKILILDKNPYDAMEAEYFVKVGRRNSYLSGWNKTKLQLVRNQKGVCPACEETLDAHQESEVHHRLSKALGGSNKTKNLVVLHTECHKQVTHCRKGSELRKRLILKGVILEAGER